MVVARQPSRNGNRGKMFSASSLNAAAEEMFGHVFSRGRFLDVDETSSLFRDVREESTESVLYYKCT